MFGSQLPIPTEAASLWLLLCCCVLQANWALDFCAILLTLPPSHCKSADITDAHCIYLLLEFWDPPLVLWFVISTVAH